MKQACTDCGQELPMNIKVCPQCGSRKFGENRKSGSTPNASSGTSAGSAPSIPVSNINNNSIGVSNISTLGSWVVYLCYASIVLAVISIISDVVEYNLLKDFREGIYTSSAIIQQTASSNDMRQMLLFIPRSILILRWIYVANVKARSKSATQMSFSPTSSIVWYFIPFLSWWKPYQAMKELWRVTQGLSSNPPYSGINILPIWWTLWLIYSFVSQISFKTALKAEEINELLTANILGMSEMVLIIPLLFVFIKMVKEIESHLSN
jgi:hypothetical protein